MPTGCDCDKVAAEREARKMSITFNCVRNFCRGTVILLTLFFQLTPVAVADAPHIGTDQAEPAGRQPLKVFVLVGQSNMQGHARINTLEHLAMDPESQKLLAKIQETDGQPKVFDDVWISYLSGGGVKAGKLTTGFGADDGKIGPELTFGAMMHEHLQEPILIIKTAWGGKSLHTDFRPPSADPYKFRAEQLEQFARQDKDVEQILADKAKASGHYYRLMIDHVQSVLGDIGKVYPDYDTTQGYELAGMVWFQGWNDMVDGGVYPDRGNEGGYDQYKELLAHFIRDVRRDLDAPELPFVIGVMGAGGPTDQYGPSQQRYKSIHQNFRDAMAAPANLEEFQDNVACVLTEKYWDPQLTELRQRQGQLNRAFNELNKQSDWTKQEQQQKRQEMMAAEFDGRELKILEVGISTRSITTLAQEKSWQASEPDLLKR